jgi:hypothetical protein
MRDAAAAKVSTAIHTIQMGPFAEGRGGEDKLPSKLHAKAPDLYTHSRVVYRVEAARPHTDTFTQATHRYD